MWYGAAPASKSARVFFINFEVLRNLFSRHSESDTMVSHYEQELNRRWRIEIFLYSED